MNKNFRIVQLTPSISYGDAVSNDIFAMSDVLTKLSYKNIIVSIGAANKVKSRITPFSKFVPRSTDVFIYHMSIGSILSEYVINAKVKRKIMVYHNITPASFFKELPQLGNPCSDGRNELKKLRYVIDFAICDSEYNKEELDILGYKQTVTLPIVFNTAEYISTPPSEAILREFEGDGYTNILFVGRIAPNKKQEDIIHSFSIYNKYINPKSRLFLVGSSVNMDGYYNGLCNYIEENSIQNVIFSGHVSFPDIIAYYKLSHIFLCESEHEGFCVPLLEAMTFNIPIIAYNSTAIPYTLGSSGVLFSEKNHEYIAELINIIAENDNLRGEIIDGQNIQLEKFSFHKTMDKFGEIIAPWIKDD